MIPKTLKRLAYLNTSLGCTMDACTNPILMIFKLITCPFVFRFRMPNNSRSYLFNSSCMILLLWTNFSYSLGHKAAVRPPDGSYYIQLILFHHLIPNLPIPVVPESKAYAHTQMLQNYSPVLSKSQSNGL